jgi:hypothetical protein
MSQGQILTWIVALVVLEVFHLKWIWWTEWDCRKCGKKNERCACEGRKWMLYL